MFASSLEVVPSFPERNSGVILCLPANMSSSSLKIFLLYINKSEYIYNNLYKS